MSELKPCPFCGGGKLSITTTYFEPAHRDAYAVSCLTVDCAAALFTLGHGLFPTVEAAIAAWNTRAPAEQVIRVPEWWGMHDADDLRKLNPGARFMEVVNE